VPWTYDSEKARRLRGHLKTILTRLVELAPDLKGAS